MRKCANVFILLATVLLVCFLDIGTAENTKGNCTQTITYSIDSNGVLLLEGQGMIPDYGYFDEKLWESEKNNILKIVIGEGITRVGDYAFAWLPSVKEVVLSSTVESIGKYAFDECSLETIVIPESVTLIDSYAFRQTNLTSIILPANILFEGYGQFEGCGQLKSVQFCSGITKITKDMFANCSALQSVSLPDSLVKIEDQAFSNCNLLKEISIPMQTELSVYNPFSGDNISFSFSKNQTRYVFSDPFVFDTTKNMIVHCNSAASKVVIPEGVEFIGGYAFARSNISSVAFPKSLKGISEGAFSDCHSLSGSMTFPTGLQGVASDSFDGCENLTDLYFGEYTTISGWICGRDNPNGIIIHAPAGTQIEEICKEYDLPFVAEVRRLKVNHLILQADQEYSFAIDDENTYVCEFTPSTTGYYRIYLTSQSGSLVYLYDQKDFDYEKVEKLELDHCGASKGGEGQQTIVYDKPFVSGTTYYIPFGTYASFNDSVTIWVEFQGTSFSGKCGDNAYWSFDLSGVFRISGTGGTYDDLNDNRNKPEFYDLLGYPTSLVVEEGITKITYLLLTSVKDIQLPSTLYEIGDRAFLNYQVESIIIPDGVEIIGVRALWNFAKQIHAPGSVLVIGSNAFGFEDADVLVYAPTGSYVERWCKLNSIKFESDGTVIETKPRVFEESVMGDYVYGKCGPNLEWKLDCYGCLEITGTGPMYDFLWSASTDNYTIDDKGYVTTPISVCPWEPFKYGIVEVNINSGATTIGAHAFEQTWYLSSVSIPNTVEEIHDYAFWGGISTSINVGSGSGNATNSANSPVSGMNYLRHIDIPGSVRSIGKQAFYNCQYLIPTLHDGLQKIGDGAFSTCGLFTWTDIKIPQTVTSIGKGAFDGLIYTESIQIPSSVTYIAEGAFGSLGGGNNGVFNPVKLDPENPNYIMKDGTLYSKDGTVLLFQSKFRGNGETYYIPSTVTRIGEYAFAGTHGYSAIVLPDGLISIGSKAFFGSDMETLIIPETVKQIGANAFNWCKRLKTAVILGTTTSINERAFEECTGLETVTISEGTKVIARYAFSGCTSLTEISLPQSLECIDQNAFGNCPLQIVRYNGTEEAWEKTIIVEEGNASLLEADREYNEVDSETDTVEYTVFLDESTSSTSGSVFVYSINDGEWIEGVYMTFIEVNKGDKISFKAIQEPCYFMQFWYDVANEKYCYDLLFSEYASESKLLHLNFIRCGHGNVTEVEAKESDCSTEGNVYFIRCNNCDTYLDRSFTYHEKEYYVIPIDPEGCREGTYDRELKIITCSACNRQYDLSKASVLNLPSGLITIKEEAFVNTGAEVIIVPENCQFISQGAFDGCAELKYILLPMGMDYVFGDDEIQGDVKILNYR